MKRFVVSCLFLSVSAFGAGCGSELSPGASPSDQPPVGQGPPSRPNPDPVNPDPGQPTVPTEFLVLRVGSGNAPMQNNVATPAFIELRKIADGSPMGQGFALPTAINGNQYPLTLSGSGASEGALSRTTDGRYVLLAGYDVPPGTSAVVDTARRVVGRIGRDGMIDTSTVVDGLNGSGNYIRSAASTDGNALWLSGVLGIAYTTLGKIGDPVARPLGSTANSRVLGFYDGQLYVSRASDGAGGINSVGTGAPTTSSVMARQLPGFGSPGNVLSPYGFVAFDRDEPAGIDRLYVADDRTDGNGGIQRWRLNNNSWGLDGTISCGAGSGCRGLAGYVNGSEVVLIASTSESGAATRLLTFTDNGGAPGELAGKHLATAPANTAFRGVALPPGE
jgi:hypothetical protein